MHLSNNEILLYLDGKISSGKKTEIERHLSECSECTSKLAGIYIFSEDIDEADVPEIPEEIFNRAKSLVPEEGKGKNSINKIPVPSLVFVLSILIVSAIAIFFYFSLHNNNIKQLEYREESPVPYSISLSPRDGAVLGSNYLNFSWEKVNNALEYKVTVYDLDGRIIFNKSLRDTILELNGRNYFIPGNKYLWNVIVYLPDGRYIKSSVHSFEFLK